MKIKLICVGKLKEKYLDDGIKEYLKRISAYSDIEVIEVADERIPENPSLAEEMIVKAKEGRRILDKVKQDSPLIFLIDDRQPLEQQVFIQPDLSPAVGHDLPCQPSGGDHGHIPVQFFRQAVNDPVYGSGSAVYGAALHALHRIFPDDMLRGLQADAAQLRCVRGEGIKGYPDPRIDHPADVILIFIDHADCIRSPHVEDQKWNGIFCDRRH